MVGEIAAKERIPRKFLEQILLELKRHGIVQSRRGRFGGYGLLMPADRITFGQVLRILDGPIAPLPCLSRIAYRRCADCQSEESCEIRRVFAKVAEVARDVLDRTTIADAISLNGSNGRRAGTTRHRAGVHCSLAVRQGSTNWSMTSAGSSQPAGPMSWAGTPATVRRDGTSCRTTLPAATRTQSPTLYCRVSWRRSLS